MLMRLYLLVMVVIVYLNTVVSIDSSPGIYDSYYDDNYYYDEPMFYYDAEDNDFDNDGIPNKEDNDDDNDGIPDAGPGSTPAPPTVQSCCPPGSRLRLKNIQGGGYSAQCLNLTRPDDVDEEIHLVIDGYKLPQCSRGMQVERVGIRTNESSRGVSSSTIVPEVVEEEEEYKEPEFAVKNYESSNPFGWRLAAVSDVLKSNLSTVRDDVKSALSDWEWGIACLENDARIFGGGYGFEIQEGISCGSTDHLGHKLIVTGGRRLPPQIAPPVTTPPPPAKEYKGVISSNGQLLISDKTFESGTFCIETKWEEWDPSDRVFNEHSEDGEAITLACDLCKEEVLCTYLEKFYTSNYVNYGHQSDNKLIVKAFIGEFKNFEEFKTSVETFIKNVWKLIDSDEDGRLTEILKQTEIRMSSNFLLKVSEFLFEKFDIDWDDEISSLDYFELTGESGGYKKLGRTLISFPSPIFQMYARLDEDRNEGLSLKEINNFLKRTFALIDKNEDCLIDLTEVIAALDESKLPKNFQLALKQLAQHQLTIANHALNRFFEVADSNYDNITEVQELLKLSDFDFIESETMDILIIAQPNRQVIRYLNGDSQKYEEAEVKRYEIWLETLQNLMMNQVYKMEESNVKCGS